MFSALHQAVVAKVKDQAATARERLQAVTEKVLQEVVESEAFKKHVAFNVEEPKTQSSVGGEDDVAQPSENLDLPEAQGDPLGYVTVYVSRVAGLKASARDIFVEAQVEGTVKRTLVSSNVNVFDWDKKMMDWDVKEALDFPISDIKGTMAIRVMQENVLIKEQLIGQVIIPIERFFPSLKEEFRNFSIATEERKSRFEIGPTIYELFPLPRSRTRFTPALKDAANSGLNKPDEALGYARIMCTFTPINASVTPLWFTRAYIISRAAKRRKSNKILSNVTLDVARTQRHVHRQLSRLEKVLERVVLGPFPPTLAFSYARSWESSLFSITFVFGSSLCILYLPAFLLPLYLFACLLIGGALAYHLGEPSPTVWNQEIRDPDDALNPMQRIAKLLWILETLSIALVDYADYLERLIHGFGFRDVRASILLFLLAFCATIGTCILGYLIPFRHFVFVTFLGWTFAPVDFRARYHRLVSQVKSGRLLQPSPLLQPLANLFAKVPTTEALGSGYISDLQIVQNTAIVDRVEKASPNAKIDE